MKKSSKKLLSLALTLVMALALAVPASAAYEVTDKQGKTYVFSNDPVTTVKVDGDWRGDVTVYVVPDGTVVSAKENVANEFGIALSFSYLVYDYYDDGEKDVWTMGSEGGGGADVLDLGAEGPYIFHVNTIDSDELVEGYENIGITVATESTIAKWDLMNTFGKVPPGDAAAPSAPAETTPAGPATAAAPASSGPYDYNNGKCTYKLSNAPIGTVAAAADGLTVLVVPDNTTVTKTASGGRLVYNLVSVQDGTFAIYDERCWSDAGTVEVEPSYDGYALAYQFWTDSANDGVPDESNYLDWDEDGICVMAQSAVAAGGLTMQPMSSAPAAPAATGTGFPDVADTSAFAPGVKWAVENGVTAGKTDGTFGPSDTCTQAHILTFLWRAAGEPEPAGTVEMEDFDGTEYYYKAAQWAAEQNLIGGEFDPGAPCTRSMVVTYLWKLAGSPEVSSSAAFPDVAADAAYAQAVAWAVENGITTGKTDGSFGPEDTCTRGQIVTFLYRNFAK